MTDDQQPDQQPDQPVTGARPGRPPIDPEQPAAGSEPGRSATGSEPGRSATGSEPGWPESTGGEPAGRRGEDRAATLGDVDMPAAGRRPAPHASGSPGPHAPEPAGPPSSHEPASAPERDVDVPLDPHAPLSADGPTVRLTSALPPLSVPGGASAPEPGEPADEPVAAGDEPTVISPPAGRDDEPTTRLTPPPAPAAADDEPARRAGATRSPDDGETRRLQPPFFAPETTRAPRRAPAPERPAPASGGPEPHLASATEAPDDVTPPDHAAGQDDPWHGHAARAVEDSADREALERRLEGSAGGEIPGQGQVGSSAAAEDDAAAGDFGGPAGEAAERGRTGVRAPDGDGTPIGSPGVTVGSPHAVAGSPDRAVGAPGVAAGGAGDGAVGVPEKGVTRPRFSSAGALIWLLLALLGFTMVVQLRSNDDDGGLATARQEDLVGILSDLEARDQRLQQEINALEESQRQLTSGVAGRQAALAEAGKRADELGLLSGTLPARGPGLKISIDPRGQPIKASALLNAVQELRGAGGEVMEIIGDNGVAVRIVASSYFVDAAGGQVIVDGNELSGPYTLWVIGVPSTMQTALQIPGGVVASVSQAGGNVTMEQRSTVEVAAVRQPTSLQYARPVS